MSLGGAQKILIDSGVRLILAFEKLKASGMSRIAIYGAGQHTRRLEELLDYPGIEILTVLDDQAQPGDSLFGIPCIRPDQLETIPKLDAIVISSDVHEPQMYQRCCALGCTRTTVCLYTEGADHDFERLIQGFESLYGRGYDRVGIFAGAMRATAVCWFCKQTDLAVSAIITTIPCTVDHRFAAHPVMNIDALGKGTVDALIVYDQTDLDTLEAAVDLEPDSFPLYIANDPRFEKEDSRCLYDALWDAKRHGLQSVQLYGNRPLSNSEKTALQFSPVKIEEALSSEKKAVGFVALPGTPWSTQFECSKDLLFYAGIRSFGHPKPTKGIHKLLIVSDVRFWKRSNGCMVRISSLIQHYLSQDHVNVYLLFRGPLSRFEMGVLKEKYQGLLVYHEVVPERIAKGDNFKAPDFYSDSFRIASEYVLASLQPDSVIVEYIRLAYVVPDAQHPLRSRSRFCIDTHDVMSLRCERFHAAGEPHWVDISYEEEQAILSRFDLVLAIQNKEKIYFEKMLPDTLVMTLLHGMKVRATPPAPSDPISVMFVGANYAANREAVKMLLTELWARPSLSAMELNIYGAVCKTIDPDTLPLGVTLHGYVEDLSSAYSAASVVVNPVPFGGGLKIKNVEALCYAKPLITSTLGAEGMERGIGTAFLVADTVDELESALLTLQDFKNRNALGMLAAAFAEKHFGKNLVYQTLDQWLTEASTSAETQE